MKKICIKSYADELTKNKIYDLIPHEKFKDKMKFIGDRGFEIAISKSEIPKLFSNISLTQTFQESDSMEDLNKRTKPSYYNQEGITPFDYIKSNNLNFFEGNIIKYITRYKEKNGLEDLKKAEIYLKEIIKSYVKNII